jgi:hypothetical protein
MFNSPQAPFSNARAEVGLTAMAVSKEAMATAASRVCDPR